ncbi:MAG: translation initiation factor IF-3 [Phycisphaerales bacterium]|nr:MAG: translation initiation factor IF-3 [Phycisphaerales bacterium]
MARRRYFRPQDNINRGPRINEFIRRSPVRLIDENDQMVGIVDIEEARRRAREAGLDLVEVSPDTDPPVCKIRDFGKWKYEQSKKDKASRAKSKAAELKEVRLGRSMKIDPHDIEIRMNQARRFLLEGHKVQIVQNFRGREMVHRERGTERMQQIIEKLSDISKLETPPRMAGRRMTMILAPDKVKIEQFRRKETVEAGRSSPPRPPEEATPQADKSTGEMRPDDSPDAAVESPPADTPAAGHTDVPSADATPEAGSVAPTAAD